MAGQGQSAERLSAASGYTILGSLSEQAPTNERLRYFRSEEAMHWCEWQANVRLQLICRWLPVLAGGRKGIGGGWETGDRTVLLRWQAVGTWPVDA